MAKYPFIHRPVDPNRKRFYIVDTDPRRSTTDMELLNEDELLGPDSPSTVTRVRMFAGKYTDGSDAYYSARAGLPKFYAMPRIKVGIRNKPLDIYCRTGRFYVSSPAKQMLESLDPDGFAFAECDTSTRRNVRLESYWMMDVKRLVQEFDGENSVYREYGGRNPEPMTAAPGITEIYDIRMSSDMPDHYHAFYLIQYSRYFIFDEVIVDAWRAAKLTGLIFSPLQPPTKDELKSESTVLSYKNYHYFTERYRSEWEDLV